MSKLFKEYVSTLNILEEAKLDLVKGMSGNKAAARRARHQLRAVRDKTNNLVKLSLQHSSAQPTSINRHHFCNGVVDLFSEF